jgi:hypothetical protein
MKQKLQFIIQPLLVLWLLALVPLNLSAKTHCAPFESENSAVFEAAKKFSNAPTALVAKMKTYRLPIANSPDAHQQLAASSAVANKTNPLAAPTTTVSKGKLSDTADGIIYLIINTQL